MTEDRLRTVRPCIHVHLRRIQCWDQTDSVLVDDNSTKTLSSKTCGWLMDRQTEMIPEPGQTSSITCERDHIKAHSPASLSDLLRVESADGDPGGDHGLTHFLHQSGLTHTWQRKTLYFNGNLPSPWMDLFGDNDHLTVHDLAAWLFTR